jgi:hypothetical protein
MTELDRRSSRHDAIAAVTFAALAVWAFLSASQAAAETIRRYGHNVDSGAYRLFLALFYLVPVAVLFALAALSHWRGWRVARGLHWVAFLYALSPFVIVIGVYFASAL